METERTDLVWFWTCYSKTGIGIFPRDFFSLVVWASGSQGPAHRRGHSTGKGRTVPKNRCERYPHETRGPGSLGGALQAG